MSTEYPEAGEGQPGNEPDSMHDDQVWNEVDTQVVDISDPPPKLPPAPLFNPLPDPVLAPVPAPLPAPLPEPGLDPGPDLVIEIPDPPVTGDPDVDEAVDAVARAVSGVPLAEQLAVYEDAHRTLQDRLADDES